MGWGGKDWSGLAWVGAVLVWDLVRWRLVDAGLFLRRVFVLVCSTGLRLFSSCVESVWRRLVVVVSDVYPPRLGGW